MNEGHYKADLWPALQRAIAEVAIKAEVAPMDLMGFFLASALSLCAMDGYDFELVKSTFNGALDGYESVKKLVEENRKSSDPFSRADDGGV